MFAAPVDMEPGFWFRCFAGGPALQFVGVEPVVSRFPGKWRVRVLVADGAPFVVDADRRFPVIEWEARR